MQARNAPDLPAADEERDRGEERDDLSLSPFSWSTGEAEDNFVLSGVSLRSKERIDMGNFTKDSHDAHAGRGTGGIHYDPVAQVWL